MNNINSVFSVGCVKNMMLAFALATLALGWVSVAQSGNPGFGAAVNGGYQFVGFSSASTLPNVGWYKMHEMCQQTFDNTTRMCTTKEMFESVDLANFPSGGIAWIQPVIASVTYYPPYAPKNILYVDVTGRSWFEEPFTSAGTAGSGGTCGTWLTSNSTDTGMRVVDFDGRIGFSPTNCGYSYPVSCCDRKSPRLHRHADD